MELTRAPALVVLVALSFTDARRWRERQPAPPGTIVVTPRTPYGAHGRQADAVLVTDAAAQLIEPDQLADLVARSLPALYVPRSRP